MYETVPWQSLHSSLRKTWRQSEHLLAIGPTGCGKTQLLSKLLPIRKYVVVFGTKTYDDSYNDIIKSGFTRITKWPPMRHQDKVMFWPKKGENIRETMAIQRRAFGPALDQIFTEKAWTVVFDELNWMSEQLHLDIEVKYYHHQGRSSKLTLVDGFQRPANVPLIVYSSATHAFIWKTTEKTDLDRLKRLGGVDRNEIEENMRDLEEYEFIYIHTRNGSRPVRSKVAL